MNIGKSILLKLKNEITQNEYERYIKNIDYDDINSRSDIAIFITPNIIISKWIKTKYSEKIAHLFEIEIGIKPKIEIEIGNVKIKKKEKSKFIENKNSPKSTHLNPSFTFDNFIVGPSNQFAYTAAKSVTEKPGKLYNPLYFYGGVGLGKTHLLNAIGNHYLQQKKKIIYTTAEQFMNSMTSHLRSQTMDRFRDKYRDCDLLLVDDIQFLRQKERTQEEFFNTFNELHQMDKQIVITSDRPPKKLKDIKDRLVSRFEWGLLADIQPPELETKISIINKKCELDGIKLNDEIINYIATNMGSNIREIEGAIIKLNAMSSMLNQEITLEFARSAIKDSIKERQENITIDSIVNIVSKEMNIKPSDIKSKKRTKNIVSARRVVIYLARNLTPNSTPQIAQYVGMKDHSAISHALKKINEIIENDENFKLLLDDFSHKIEVSTKENE